MAQAARDGPGDARDCEPAAVLHRPGDLRIEPRQLDRPGEREVLVKVAAVGICGSDVHYFEHGSIGRNVIRGPHILGHEFSGRVIAAGASAARPAIGQRVAVEPGIPCRACAQCSDGHYNLCRDLHFLGAPPFDGALRGHIAVDAEFVFPLPDTISDQAGALIEPLAVAVWSCRRARVSAGDRVLVTGAGPIGLLVAQVAGARGAGEVTIVDLREQRLLVARRLGVSRTLTAGELEGFAAEVEVDVLIECSGSATALAAGIDAVRPAGTVVVVGMSPEGSVNVRLEYLQRRELTVTGSFRYAGCYPEAIALAAGGRVALEPLITVHYPLHSTRAALTAGRQDPAQIKAMVLP